MKTLEIGFGPLNKTLKEQLALQDFACDDKSLEKIEKLRNSINMLYIHGYINDNTKDKCFSKLFKEIQSKLKLSN